MKSVIRKIRTSDMVAIEDNLLPINKEEIRAMRGGTFTDVFIHDNELMDNTEVLLIDDEIVCVGGNMPTSDGSVVWLFGTNKIEKNKRHFAKVIFDRFNKMKECNDLLFSFVYDKNDMTKNWLKMLGFTIHDAEPIGKNGELFCYFEWKSDSRILKEAGECV